MLPPLIPSRGALNTPSPVLSLFSITTVPNVHRATRHRLRLSQTRQPAALTDKPRVSVWMVHFTGLLTSVYSHSGWQYELFKTLRVRSSWLLLPATRLDAPAAPWPWTETVDFALLRLSFPGLGDTPRIIEAFCQKPNPPYQQPNLFLCSCAQCAHSFPPLFG